MKQLVKSIEDSAPGRRLDVARYVPAHHDEFIGDTEPFYYGLFQQPKRPTVVKPPLPYPAARPRVGLVGSKPRTKAKKAISSRSKKNNK